MECFFFLSIEPILDSQRFNHVQKNRVAITTLFFYQLFLA